MQSKLTPTRHETNSVVRILHFEKSLSLIFMLWRVMSGWLSEGLVGRDFVFEGRSRDKASSRACRGDADTNHHLGRAKWVVLDNVCMQSLVRIDF